MVEFRIIIGDEAKINLRDIHYYLKNTVSYNVANIVVWGILDSVEVLKTIPKGHKIVDEISSDNQTYHRLLKWSYKIIFVVDENKQTIKVVDIIHIKRNPQYLIDKYGEAL